MKILEAEYEHLILFNWVFNLYRPVYEAVGSIAPASRGNKPGVFLAVAHPPSKQWICF